MNSSKVFLVTALALTACSSTGQNVTTLVPEVNRGPAAEATPKKVLSLSATCGALSSRCTDENRAAVDNIIRGRMEFAGYSMIDSNTLRLATRTRTEEQTTTTTTTTTASKSTEIIHPLVFLPILGASAESTGTTQSQTTTETSFVVLTGPNFEDLSVEDRREVIEKSGADALLSVRIVLGGSSGVWTPNQDVEVSVKLSIKKGDEMAWASRCVANSRDMSTLQVALENAARCAINGVIEKN